MKSTITNAAEITVLQPIDNNYKTGGGDISVGGCVAVAVKGKPFEPMKVYGGTSDLVDKFGTPLPKKSAGMEGLRHVHDASEDCSYVNVVRAVNSTSYRYPSKSFLIFRDLKAAWASGVFYKENDIVLVDSVQWLATEDNTASDENKPGTTGAPWILYAGPTSDGAHKWNATVTLGDGVYLCIWPVDGDTSVNRYIQIYNVDNTAKRFTIRLYDKDELGEAYLVESHEVGVSEDDKDDLGLSAYIETVLERDSDILRCDFLEGKTWADVYPLLQAVETTRTAAQNLTFVGGVSGGTPTTQDFVTAADVFRNERVACNLLFAAGIIDETVLSELADIADERHIAFFYDVPGSLKAEEAMDWNSSLALSSRHSRAYYAPYSATDQWRGGSTVWGVSGAMAAAKARANAIVTAGATPGVHYSPAGESRSYLSRTGCAQLFPSDTINRDEFYDARINPVIPMSSGGCCADDDLTQWFKTNYLRFGWINDVLDYIDHRFLEAAAQVKFEPDGITQMNLYDLTCRIMEDLVTSGALVTPREPDRDGTSPYKVTVEQIEIDLWKVTWEVCITGAARRIAGQPKLIR